METISPSVFISYSHDSKKHKKRCYRLKTQLKRNGCTCIIDQDEFSPKQGWPRWCEDQIDECDFVLVVCTKIYYERYRGKATSGKGVGYEGFIITQILYENYSLNEKFIPVCFEKEDIEYIPISLKAGSFYLINDKKEYKKLLRRLFNKPENIATEIGSPPKLSSRISKGLFENKILSFFNTITKKIGNLSYNQWEKTSIIEITIDKNINEYSAEDQKKLLLAFMTILEVSDIRIVRKKAGSVKLAIALPSDKAKHLQEAVQSGLLNEHKIINTKIYYDIQKWYYLALTSLGVHLTEDEISMLPNLQVLNLYSNWLSRLEGFPVLPDLQELDLGSNHLRSLEGLPDLPNLQVLNLRSNWLSSLEGLPDLPNLSKLDLRGNPLHKKEVDILKRKLPECEIIFVEDSSGLAEDKEVPVEPVR